MFNPESQQAEMVVNDADTAFSYLTPEELFYTEHLLKTLESEGIDSMALKNNTTFMNDPMNFDLNAYLKESIANNGLEDGYSVSAGTAFAAGVGDKTSVERHGKGAKRSTIKGVFAFAKRKVAELGQSVAEKFSALKEEFLFHNKVLASTSVALAKKAFDFKAVQAAAGVAAILVLANGFGGATADNPSEKHHSSHPVIEQMMNADSIPSAGNSLGFDFGFTEADYEQMVKTQMEEDALLATVAAKSADKHFKEAQVKAEQEITVTADAVASTPLAKAQMEEDALLAAVAAKSADKHFKEAQVKAEQEITVTADAVTSTPLANEVAKPNIVEPSADLATALQEGADNARIGLQMATLSKFMQHYTVTEAANDLVSGNVDPNDNQFERQKFEQTVVASIMTMRGIYQDNINNGDTERSAFNDARSQMNDLGVSVAASDTDISALGMQVARVIADKSPELLKLTQKDDPGMADKMAVEAASVMAGKAADHLENQGVKRMTNSALNGIFYVDHPLAESIHNVNLSNERNNLMGGSVYIDKESLGSLNPEKINKVMYQVAVAGVKDMPHSDPSLLSRTATQASLIASDAKSGLGNVYGKAAEKTASSYDAVADAASSLASGAKSGLGNVYDKAAEKTTSLASGAKSGLGNVYDKAAEKTTSLASGAKSGLGNVYDKAAEKTASLASGAKSGLGNVYGKAAEKTASSYDAVADAASSLASGAKNTFSSAYASIAAAYKDTNISFDGIDVSNLSKGQPSSFVTAAASPSM